MKKIVITVLFLILALPISVRAEIDQPQNVPMAEKFELLKETLTTCGTMQLWISWVSDTEAWSKRFLWGDGTDARSKEFLDHLSHPLVLRHTVLLTSNEIVKDEIWLDRNRDRVFDEKYLSFDKLAEKYPTPCDAAL